MDNGSYESAFLIHYDIPLLMSLSFNLYNTHVSSSSLHRTTKNALALLFNSIRSLRNHIHRDNAFEKNVYRSEEHTSELQSHSDLVCRLLLEKKKRSGRGSR